jgi:hypothetical protein
MAVIAVAEQADACNPKWGGGFATTRFADLPGSALVQLHSKLLKHFSQLFSAAS